MLFNRANVFQVGFLSVLQAIGYIFPLLTIPILISRIGVAGFGSYTFGLSISVLLVLVVEFGFNMAAPVEAAKNASGDKQALVARVIAARLFLFVVQALAIVLYAKTVGGINGWLKYLLVIQPIALGAALSTEWVLIFDRKTYWILVAGVITKAGFLLYLIVSESLSAQIALSTYSVLMLLNGVCLLTLVGRAYPGLLMAIKQAVLDYRQIIRDLGSSLHYFSSKASIELYRGTVPVILGILVSETVVGFYYVAEKVTSALQSLQIPVGRVLLPRAIEHRELIGTREYVHGLLSIFRYFLAAYLVLFLLQVMLSEKIAIVLSGQNIEDISELIRSFAIVIVLGGANYFLGILGLVSVGEDRYFALVLLIVGVISPFIAVVLILRIAALGGVYSVVLAEFLVLIFVVVRFIQVLKRDDLPSA